MSPQWLYKFGQSTCLRKCVNWIITRLNRPAKIQTLSNTGTSLWQVQLHIWPSLEWAVQAWTSALLRDLRVCARQVAADLFRSFQLLWPHLIRSMKAGQAMAVVAVRRPRDFPEARTWQCDYCTWIQYDTTLSDSWNQQDVFSKQWQACEHVSRWADFRTTSHVMFSGLSASDKSNMPSPWIQNSSLSYPRWKPSASSQTAASHDPEILKTRPADSTSCDSFPHRFRTIWSNDWLCSESWRWLLPVGQCANVKLIRRGFVTVSQQDTLATSTSVSKWCASCTGKFQCSCLTGPAGLDSLWPSWCNGRNFPNSKKTSHTYLHTCR